MGVVRSLIETGAEPRAVAEELRRLAWDVHDSHYLHWLHPDPGPRELLAAIDGFRPAIEAFLEENGRFVEARVRELLDHLYDALNL